MRGDREKFGKRIVLVYRGVEAGVREHRVGLILGPRVAQFLQEVRGTNERLIEVVFKIKGKEYRIYQICVTQ